ncbi:MAG: MFS transporter [Thermodesulfobacteriota bacterium]
MQISSSEQALSQPRVFKLSLLAVALIAVSHTYVDALTHIFPIALPIFKEKFSLSFAQVGLVATVFQLTSSVIQPVFGIMSDRWQTNWFIPLGVLWSGLTISLVGYVSSYTGLLLLVFFAGFGTAAYHPRALKALADSVRKKKGLANATFMFGGNVGFALGPLVAAFLFLNYGLTYSLLLFLPAFILLPGLWRYLPQYAASHRRVISEGKEGKQGSFIFWGFTGVCMIVIVRSWVNSGFVVFLPLFLQSRGLELALAGKLLSLFLFSGAFGALLGGYLSDICGRKRIILISLFVFSPMALLFLQNPTGPAAPVFLAVAGAAIYAPFTVALTLAQELIPSRTGLASGMTLGLGFGVGGIGAYISGIFSDTYGLELNMLFLALLPLAAIPLLWLIKQR